MVLGTGFGGAWVRREEARVLEAFYVEAFTLQLGDKKYSNNL